MAGIWSRFRSPTSSTSPTSPASHVGGIPLNGPPPAVNPHFVPEAGRYTGPSYLPPAPAAAFPVAPAVPGVAHLRALFASLPQTSRYYFSPDIKTMVLKELWSSFWGPFGSWFYGVDEGECKRSFEFDGNLTKAQRAALIDPDGEEREAVGSGKTCEYVFERGDVGYRCRDCALDDTCVMCSRCFDASDHTGHIVTFHIAHHTGGYCDCGDAECWRANANCRLHPLPDPTNSPPSFPGSYHPPQPPVHGMTYNILPQLPEDLRQCMTQTVAFALDFVLETLDLSPDDTINPMTEADITKAPTCDPHLPVPFSSTASGTQFTFNPFGTPTSSPTRTNAGSLPHSFSLSPASNPFGPPRVEYAVVVWNDEKHSFQEVIDVLQDSTACDEDLAKNWTQKIHNTGRAVVDRSTDVFRLLHISKQIAQVDLGVTVRRASDTFREEITAAIIEWLVDVSTARLGGHSLATREVLVQALFASRAVTTTSLAAAGLTHNAGNQSVDYDGLLGKRLALTRIEYLFCYHTRLWRQPRLLLKQMYVSLFRVSPFVRIHMATLYAQVYHHIVGDYLLVDREAETSMRNFSDQLFAVPSVAAHLVNNTPLPQRILGLIVSFFTNHISEGGKTIMLPPKAMVEIDVNSFPFRSKRFVPLFSDMRALCVSSATAGPSVADGEGAARVLTGDYKLLGALCDMCEMFTGINPNARAAVAHVEFETDAWVSVFNVMLCMAKLIKAFGEMYDLVPRRDMTKFHTALGYVLQRTVIASRKQLDNAHKSKINTTNYHQVTFGGYTQELVRFDVMDGWVSFHHPLHWFLAEMFRRIDLLSNETLASYKLTDLKSLVFSKCEGQNLLVVVEYPLRVITMVAQVRAGLWVRNGFAIRGQLVHYREYMLRELCYDQDLFLLQCGLALLEPHLVLTTILDRFQLLGWFSGRTPLAHEKYDPSQLGIMLEEFLFVLLVCVGETGYVMGITIDAQVRREIIHALALGACSYTELSKRLSDRIVDEKSFDRILVEVSNFKPPTGLSDVGMYELRDELFDEVNHFFYHYTRNRREEMEAILKARKKKATGEDNPVLVPKPLRIEKGNPYASLPSVLYSDVMIQILFFALWNFLPTSARTIDNLPPYTDIVIDQALQIIMLALVEIPDAFSYKAAKKTLFDSQSLLTVLCATEGTDRFQVFRPRIAWCLEVFQTHMPNETGALRRTSTGGVSASDQAEAAKKRAAKARQEAIMKQFQAAQQSFKLNNLDAEEGDVEVDNLLEDFDDMIDDAPPKPVGTCIVCQEDLNPELAFGMLCSVMPSRVIRTTSTDTVEWVEDALTGTISLDRKAEQQPTLSPSAIKKGKHPQGHDPSKDSKCVSFPMGYSRYGLYTHVCGHMMHVKCFQSYTDSVDHRQQHHSTRNHPENVSRKEFVCPLCKSLGNTLLPVQDNDWSDSYYQQANMTLTDWVRFQQTSLFKQFQDRSFDSLLCSNGTGEFVCWNSTDADGPSLSSRYDGDEFEWLLGDTVNHMAHFYGGLTKPLRRRPLPANGNEDLGGYLPDELVAYTLNVMEIGQRGEGEPGKTIADMMSERQARVLRGLVYTLKKMAGRPIPTIFDGGRQLYCRALCMRLLPDWACERSLGYPMLLRDPLTILIETAALAPEMIHFVVVLMYHAVLLRASLGIVAMFNRLPGRVMVPLDGPFQEIFLDFTTFIPTFFRHSPALKQFAEYALASYGQDRVKQMLYAYTLPFLRCAAMLLRAVRPSRFPPKPSSSSELSEYHRLLDLLNIPPPGRLYESETLTTLMDGWMQHYCSVYDMRPEQFEIHLDHPSVYRLVRLPTRLDTLFHNPKRFLCTRCKTMPQDPAICLFCGTVCCLQSHCCMDADAEAGECNMHMRDCGGVVGLYFLVKKCCILYLHAGNGSFGNAPYVDEHGEVDYNLRRTRLQYLHPLRYEELRKQWLAHGIPAIVARKLENSIDHGGWGTL